LKTECQLTDNQNQGRLHKLIYTALESARPRQEFVGGHLIFIEFQ